MPDEEPIDTSEVDDLEEQLAGDQDDDRDAEHERDAFPEPPVGQRSREETRRLVESAMRDMRSDLEGVLDRGNGSRPRESFFYSVDENDEPQPRVKRMLWCAAAAVVVVAVAFSAVKSSPGVGAPQESAAGPSKEAERPAVVMGSNLRRPHARYESAGLEPVTDEPVETPPETAPLVPVTPEAPRPARPNSWRTAMSVTVPELVDEVDEEDASLGLTLPEGTEVPAVLVTKIAAPDAGVAPDLNRAKAVLNEDYTEQGVVLFPRGTIFLGRVQQTGDRLVHIVFHRVVLPDDRTLACNAIASEAGTTAGLVPNKIERHRKHNLAARIGRGVLDTLAGVATGGRSAASVASAGAAAGTIEQGRDEVQDLRRPRRTLLVNTGRQILVQLTADLAL